MSRTQKIKVLSMMVFGIIFVFGNYVIVIGQTTKPVLVALNKADSTLAIIDPSSMKVVGKVPTGDTPHEVVLSADGPDAVLKINLESGEMLGRVDTGKAPDGIAVAGM